MVGPPGGDVKILLLGEKFGMIYYKAGQERMPPPPDFWGSSICQQPEEKV
jgi:hypothetical protein